MADQDRSKLCAKLSALKDSPGFYDDDKKVVKEVADLRAQIKSMDLAALSPERRLRQIIDERAAPSEEELSGRAPWIAREGS